MNSFDSDSANDRITSITGTPNSGSSSLALRDPSSRSEHELAGGVEDWEDVEGGQVDRYGFISPRRPTSTVGSSEGRLSPHTPRKGRSLLSKRGQREGGASPTAIYRMPSRKVSTRSLNTQASEKSIASRKSARLSIRAAANLLPHNRERRWLDEAGDMLGSHAFLTDIAEDGRIPASTAEEEEEEVSEETRKKEWQRSEKWRKMAKVLRKGADGQGMQFEFDRANPKLVERTWKGIPDMWRASAWYSFLEASARRGHGSRTEEQITAEFRRLQEVASPDDVQIDLDVPRTINRHIMFRRRYRGGQRLLFRVLHALSLYFPKTGYVQGMASLAATLLNYYDEEKAFVVLVRLFRFRGLDRLYQPGFEGLLAALADFEKRWLEGKEVAKKLTEHSIGPTAYATRWYLTLFNLSIPFPAQLRVWDVLMLLGECQPLEPEEPLFTSATTAVGPTPSAEGALKEGGAPTLDAQASSSESRPASTNPSTAPSLAPEPLAALTPATSSGGGVLAGAAGLDVIHAVSAALLDALRDVIVDSDFEVAMKAVTSWVAVRDEDLLMRVAKAEWKSRSRKRRGKVG